MTQEEKAKAYDNALKVLHKYDGANIMFSQSLKEEMFPELKESEDESIRKKLIGYFSSVKGFSSLEYNYGITGEDAVAWLEKQKAVDVLDEEEREFADNVDSYRKEIDAAYQKGYNEGVKAIFEKQSEQKLTELPKGEDYGIDGLWHAISILQRTLGKVEGYQSDDGILEHKCAISAVKELYERKPSWSEDDEDYYDAIIAKLEVTQDDTALTDNQMNFLKSLRPQKQWKPTEEQMKYLYKYSEQNNYDGAILTSLYNDLKQL